VFVALDCTLSCGCSVAARTARHPQSLSAFLHALSQHGGPASSGRPYFAVRLDVPV
jgi:hypothetical protein